MAMALLHAAVALTVTAATSCRGTTIELHLEPPAGTVPADTAGFREPVLEYLERAAKRYRMRRLSQADLPCRQAWLVDGKEGFRVIRSPVLFVCSLDGPAGSVDVRLTYDGTWSDSASRAARIRREFADSLGRYGVLTVRDSAASRLTSR